MIDQIKAIENQLGLSLPETYKRFLREDKKGLINGLPIYGISNNSFTIYTATQALRFARPDIPESYLAVRFLENQALCLDISRVKNGDCPMVEIEIDNNKKPTELGISFGKYIEIARQNETKIDDALRRIGNLFKNGEIIFYEHNSKDNQTPFKAGNWRVIRSCVHDYVVGLSAFCHSEHFNGLEVDVFISTDHPDYESGHGIRALTSLLLSDTYRNGTSMEIRFTRYVRNIRKRVKDQIPNQLVNLFNENGISLSNLKEGIITHFEAANLYAKLIGLNSDDVAKIKEFEMQERLSLQGVCYLISSKLWTLDEAKWILFNASRPEGILFGRDIPEDRLKFEESLSFGRAVKAISKLRNKLENDFEQEGNSTVQIENQLFHILPNQFAELDWSITSPKVQINKDEEITVLSRPRRFFPLLNQLVGDDLKPLLLTSKQTNKKFLLYSKDFIKLDKFKELTLEIKKRTNIEILVLPFTTNELDDEVNTLMRRAKAIRT